MYIQNDINKQEMTPNVLILKGNGHSFIIIFIKRVLSAFAFAHLIVFVHKFEYSVYVFACKKKNKWPFY